MSPAWAFPQGHGVSPWLGAAVKRDEGTQLTCTRSYKATIPATTALTHSVEVTYPVQEECEASFHHDKIIQGLIWGPCGIRMKWEKLSRAPPPSLLGASCSFPIHHVQTFWFSCLYEGIYLVSQYLKEQIRLAQTNPFGESEKFHFWTISSFAQFSDLFADSWYFSLILKPSICLEIQSQSIETLKEKEVGLTLFILLVLQTPVKRNVGNCCTKAKPRRRSLHCNYRDAGAPDHVATDSEGEVAKGRATICHHSWGKLTITSSR